MASLATWMAASMAANGLLASLVYGIQPGDPLTLATIAAMLLAVAATAGLIPALRAARIQGVRALRSE
jgi:ABC-type lipoprotein release transport system permease subunit